MPPRSTGKKVSRPSMVKPGKFSVIRTVPAMRRWAEKNGGICGFVPTLGALHDGHVSLIKKARSENRVAAVSIFVNPLQFRKKQYLAYPRNLEVDLEIARKAGANVVFAPSAEEMYPAGFETGVTLPQFFQRLKPQGLEWHYKGVLVVVLKLLQLVRPSKVYFGLKDPHQLVLIERMVADLNIPVTVRKCPTVRERDGLARSSRNALLTPDERKAAPVIFRALSHGKREMESGASCAQAMAGMREMISAQPLASVELVEIADALTLAPPGNRTRDVLIFAAVRIGGKRLADNVRFRLK